MPRPKSTRYPTDALTQARQVATAWQEATILQLPDVSREQYEQLIAAAQAKADEVERLTVERTKAIEARDAEMNGLWDQTRRVRHAAKAVYGDDSQEVRKFGASPVRGGRRPAKSQPQE